MGRSIILASASPRRRELLAKIVQDFEVITSDCDETLLGSPNLDQAVLELSDRKAEAVAALIAEQRTDQELIVIGADTIVGVERPGVLKGYQILGKPRDVSDAERMLKQLSGREHKVCTGVTLYLVDHGQVKKQSSFAVWTGVWFHELTDQEIHDYVETGEPMDKAGAYGIQGAAAKFIDGISGDYYNVVGLPVARLYQELKELL
jgi:septum formation protein